MGYWLAFGSRRGLATRIAGLAVAIFLLASVGVASAQASSRSAASAVPGVVDAKFLTRPTTGPVIATGRVVDAAGLGTPGLIAALALPGEAMNRVARIGSRITTPTVGWASVNADGSFLLRVDPRRIAKGYVNASGLVNLELLAWDGNSEGDWFTPVSLSTTAPTATQIQGVHIPLGRATGPDARPIGSSPAACYYGLLSTYKVWDNSGESLPWLGSGNPGTTSDFYIGTSHTVTLGVAESATGKYGTWSGSGSSSTSSGVSFQWSMLNTDRFYEIQDQYGIYVQSCTGYHYTWVIQPTGGAQWVSAPMSNWCGGPYVTYEGPGVTFTRSSSSGSDFNLGGGVLASTVLGINLSFDSSYASDRWVSYHFIHASYLCGNNNYPSSAGRINEEV